MHNVSLASHSFVVFDHGGESGGKRGRGGCRGGRGIEAGACRVVERALLVWTCFFSPSWRLHYQSMLCQGFFYTLYSIMLSGRKGLA